MNATTTAGGTAKKEYSVTVDVFDLRRVNEQQLALGSQPLGWRYANRDETLVTVRYAAAEPKTKAPFAFTQGELVDELVELFVAGRYSRTEACQILAALKGEEGGAR